MLKINLKNNADQDYFKCYFQGCTKAKSSHGGHFDHSPYLFRYQKLKLDHDFSKKNFLVISFRNGDNLHPGTKYKHWP